MDEFFFGVGSGELLSSTSLGEEKSLAVLLGCLTNLLLLLLLELKLKLHLQFWLLLLRLELTSVEGLQKLNHDPQLL